MRTSAQKYKDFTIRIPKSADPKPLEDFVEAMGWQFVLQTSTKRQCETKASLSSEMPSKSLRGIFKMSEDFDYKTSLIQALKEKYDL